MNIQMLEQWLRELSPFEKSLKEWYQKHGALMPETVFIQKHRELQGVNRRKEDPFSRLDASCRNYEQVARDKNGQYANLSRVHWREKNEQFFIQKHPNYFPGMRACIDKVSIIYMMYGQGEIVLEEERFILREGDLLLLAPGSIVIKKVCDDDTVLLAGGMTEAAFRKSLAESYPQGVLAEFFAGILCQHEKNSYLLFHTNGDEWIRHLFQRAMLEFAEGDVASYKIVPLVMELIFAYAQKEYGGKATVSVKGDESIGRMPLFLAYLQEHYQDFSLKRMARNFHLSPFYVSRSFEKYMGKTIRDTLKEIRISAAEILLRNTDYGVGDVAELVGYKDSSYFIEMFRKEKGVTPLQYRKTLEKQSGTGDTMP